MTASAEPWRLRGYFRITAARGTDGLTALTRREVAAPFHLSKPYQDGNALIVQVINSTAGILAGDELEIDIRAEAGARLLITSPSASRAFTMREGSAVCRQRFTAAAGACLDVYPEPLFPHVGCRYRQHTVVDFHPEASVFLGETIAPGRVAKGEIWAWDDLLLTTEIRCGGRIILAERLAGNGEQLRALAAANGFAEAWFSTAVLAGPALAADEGWLAALRALHRPGVWCGVSKLTADSGWSLRVIAATAPLLRETMAEARRILAPAIPVLASDMRKNQ